MKDHPDFSGVWCADFKRSKLEIEAPASTTFQMNHEDPFLLVNRMHKAKDFEDQVALQHRTDGKETLFCKGNLEIRIICSWKGTSLVCCSRFMVGESEAENVVTYTLSTDGQELLADERYSGPPRSYHNRWVLVRAKEDTV